jgi:hypothetical protein
MTGQPAEVCIIFRCNVYNLLGLKERAREVLGGLSADFDLYPSGYSGVRDRLDLLRNRDAATEEKLLERDRRSKRLQVMWHLYIALIRLGDHDRAGARRHLELAVAVHEPYQLTFNPSRAFLKRMQKDPTWPPWISPKKSAG